MTCLDNNLYYIIIVATIIFCTMVTVGIEYLVHKFFPIKKRGRPAKGDK